jgi:hypothetical protein
LLAIFYIVFCIISHAVYLPIWVGVLVGVWLVFWLLSGLVSDFLSAVLSLSPSGLLYHLLSVVYLTLWDWDSNDTSLGGNGEFDTPSTVLNAT